MLASMWFHGRWLSLNHSFKLYTLLSKIQGCSEVLLRLKMFIKGSQINILESVFCILFYSLRNSEYDKMVLFKISSFFGNQDVKCLAKSGSRHAQLPYSRIFCGRRCCLSRAAVWWYVRPCSWWPCAFWRSCKSQLVSSLGYGKVRSLTDVLWSYLWKPSYNIS